MGGQQRLQRNACTSGNACASAWSARIGKDSIQAAGSHCQKKKKKDISRGRVGNDSRAMVRILGKRECIRRLTMAVSPVSVAHDISENLKI